MLLTEKIKIETKKALKNLKRSKIEIREKDLLTQLSKEIQKMMDTGEWAFAVRLAFYRHEFAKTFDDLSWYPSFLEIRKVRDKILIMLGE